jgi:hypothetical protein
MIIKRNLKNHNRWLYLIIKLALFSTMYTWNQYIIIKWHVHTYIVFYQLKRSGVKKTKKRREISSSSIILHDSNLKLYWLSMTYFKIEVVSGTVEHMLKFFPLQGMFCFPDQTILRWPLAQRFGQSLGSLDPQTTVRWEGK